MEFLDIYKEGREYHAQVLTLYQEAFPPEEKKPEELMEMLVQQGKMEMLAIVEKEEFVGLAINMLANNKALLDYFAIVPEKRSGGWGGKAVRALQEKFKGQKYIFEIEMQDPTAENASDRARRKAFYLRNGLKETGVFANVYQTDFELLTPDGELSYEEYVQVLKDILGAEGVAVVNPCLISQEK